jgi:hypothetical protein
MRTDITCLCGAVQVQLEGEPSVQLYCHSDDCQATSCGAYVGVAIYPTSASLMTATVANMTCGSIAG